MEVAAASAITLLNIALCIRGGQYVAWYSWLGGRVFVVIVVFMVLVAVITGAVCVIGANLAGWKGTGSLPAQGLGAGLVGTAVLRADVGRPRRSGSSKGSKNATHAALQQMVAIVEALFEVRVNRWATQLAANDLTLHVAMVPASERIRLQRKHDVDKALADLASANSQTSQQGRGRLVSYLADSYMKCDKPHP